MGMGPRYTNHGMDPPPRLVAAMEMAPAGQPLVSRRKNMKFRGRDGKLLSTMATIERERKQARQARASYNLTMDQQDHRDENEVSAAQYWESEWSMYLTSGEFQFDDETNGFDDTGGGGGGGGRSRARGGGAVATSTDTVTLDNV
jgi:hypothetical protein